jgi:hypothetical protein
MLLRFGTGRNEFKTRDATHPSARFSVESRKTSYQALQEVGCQQEVRVSRSTRKRKKKDGIHFARSWRKRVSGVVCEERYCNHSRLQVYEEEAAFRVWEILEEESRKEPNRTILQPVAIWDALGALTGGGQEVDAESSW